MNNDDQFLWVERYRPQKVSETILPPSLKKTFQELVDHGDLPSMIFAGTSGLGKTTIAKALCNEMNLDWIMINGSDERNIDVLRGKIRKFASTVSLNGGRKVVIIDEAEYLNAQSTQPALRGFMEEFAKNCSFIFTCNHKERLIEALHSRTSVYEFNTSRKEMAKLASEFFKRLEEILKKEGVDYDKKVVADLVMKFAPDWRRIINEAQRYSVSGKIDEGIFQNIGEDSYDKLFACLKKKDFKGMRQWVGSNLDVDSTALFRAIYDRMSSKVKPLSQPALVMILGEYQYKAAFAADAELNIVACMTEIMSQVEFE